MAKKKFEDIDTSEFTAKKKNPFAKEEKKVSHKTIRIYEKDYEKLREIAFFSKSTIVEVVEEAVALLESQRKDRS